MDANGIMIFFLMWIGLILFGFILVIITLIGEYKVFKKAGEEGWKALIPFYNIYSISSHIGLDRNWTFILIVLFLAWNIPLYLLSLVFGIIFLYFGIIFSLDLARSFGKDESYALGLLFLPFIFYPILGFGSSTYQEPKPVEDFIMRFLNDNFLHPDNNQPNKTNHYCPNCGSKIEENTSFCGNCGKKIN